MGIKTPMHHYKVMESNLVNKGVMRWGIVMAVALMIGGCANTNNAGTSGSQGVDSKAATSTYAEVDLSPLSIYKADELLAINTKIRSLDYECYAKNGFTAFAEILPGQAENNFVDEVETPAFGDTYRDYTQDVWFNSAQQAKDSGFGHPMSAKPPFVVVVDPAYKAVKSKCDAQTLEALGQGQDTYNQYVNLGNNIAEQLFFSADQEKLMKDVLDCAQKDGVAFDRNSPNPAPGWGVEFKFPIANPGNPQKEFGNLGAGVTVIPAKPAETYQPTPQESEAATKIFQCAEKTGAHQQWRKIVKERLDAIVEKFGGQLGELNPRLDEVARSLGVTS